VCQVNVPGFPIARARVASGYVTALVAAAAPVTQEMSMAAALAFRKRVFQDHLHPRDDAGKFRKVLFRIEQDLKGKLGTKRAAELIHKAQLAESVGDFEKAKQSAQDLVFMLDEMADNTDDLDDKEMLREGSKSLGQVMAYLPLMQGTSTLKMRYTDIPLELRDLIEDLLDRAEKQMTKEGYDNASKKLRDYQSGADLMYADEIQAELSKLLRFLI
jgi:hypothetical protein